MNLNDLRRERKLIDLLGTVLFTAGCVGLAVCGILSLFI